MSDLRCMELYTQMHVHEVLNLYSKTPDFISTFAWPVSSRLIQVSLFFPDLSPFVRHKVCMK